MKPHHCDGMMSDIAPQRPFRKAAWHTMAINYSHLPRIALYQPDIPGNTGTILRMAACLGFAVDLIEPAGFDVSDRNLKRAGMDYLEMATLTRHVNWEAFVETLAGRRLVIASTKAAHNYTKFEFASTDTLLFGRESAGLPDHIHKLAQAAILIPMQEGARSLNLAVSVGMIAGEATRQLSA
jgi:tRNA (cytidine/uridine-2'-O-)-methyltransferase